MGRITRKRQSSSPLAAHIGMKLLEARQSTGVTMRMVASGAVLSVAFICEVENGLSIPSAETLWKLSKFFGVDVNYFFEGYEA